MLAVQAWRLVSMSRTRNPSGKETETGNTKTKLSNRSDPVLSQVFLKTLPYYKKAEHDQGHPKSTPDLHIHTSACISTCLHTPHTDMWKKLFHFKCNHFHDPLDSILIFITLSLSVFLGYNLSCFIWAGFHISKSCLEFSMGIILSFCFPCLISKVLRLQLCYHHFSFYMVLEI